MGALGAHMSVAGGLHKAIHAAEELGMTTVQIFTSSPSQWNAKPLDDESIELWQRHIKASSLVHPIAHASYLINLAAAEPLYRKSIDALADQWQRCESLRLSGLVVHPGAYTSSTEEEGITRIADALVELVEIVKPKHCRLLLENTAGQGTCLGHQISQLGQMISLARKQSKVAIKHLGVCIDTCHAFAAGYDIRSQAGLDELCKQIDGELPTQSVRALHLNDSKKPLGSRVDRHEHIGLGEIGLAAIHRIIYDSPLSELPGYLETEKGNHPESGKLWDEINFRALHRDGVT